MKFPIEQVWVDDEVRDEPLTRDILRKLPGARIITAPEIAEQSRALGLEADPFSRGKRILRLTKHKGAFVKPCPGTPEYVCCGLEILHIGQGCPMDCRYCALQVYFNRPVIEVFTNTEDLFSGLSEHLYHFAFAPGDSGEDLFVKRSSPDPSPKTLYARRNLASLSGKPSCEADIEFLEASPGETFLHKKTLPEISPFESEFVLAQSPPGFHRICTGEFTDSLALDPLTGLARKLVEFFSRVPNASLEIKTKTDFIDSILDVNPRGRVVIGFSVNSGEITRRDEIRAVPLVKRLTAAARAEKSGYRIAFHFDPVIPLGDWKDSYSVTINEIFRVVDPSSIAWISMGVLRFVPALKEIALARFGRIPYFHDGFLRGLDGKSRLHADRRIHVYRHLAAQIRRHAPDARIYLCMESPHVWKEGLEIDMGSDEELSAYLDAGTKDAESGRPFL